MDWTAPHSQFYFESSSLTSHTDHLEPLCRPSSPSAVTHRRAYLRRLVTAPDLYTLETWATQFNTLPPLNHRKFTLEENFIPIVLLVHDRTDYLQEVLNQYRSVVDISKTILVISHDGIYPEVLDLVLSIDFCQVKQLIFPYSVKWMQQLRAEMQIGYQLWLSNPGMLKLHWTWALTQAWYNVAYVPRDKEKPVQVQEVCYMEDDFFVAPDFYLALKEMKGLKRRVCSLDTCFASVVGVHAFKVVQRFG